MRWIALVLVLGCGKSPAPSPAEAHRVPILPDSVSAHLGTIGLAVAVDFHAIDVAALAGAQLPKLPCAHDLLVGVRDAVATVGDGGWQGIVDGVPEPAARACIAQLGLTARAGSGGGLEVAVHATPITVRWRGDVATIAESGAIERGGDPPAEMIDVIAKVPHGVAAWLAVTGLPDYKITQAVGWLEVNPKTWTFTVTAEGATPTAAKDWIDTLVRGVTVALAARGVIVDGSWFAVTPTPPTAKLVATFPVAALGAGSN